jgi:hypothetical protein
MDIIITLIYVNEFNCKKMIKNDVMCIKFYNFVLRGRGGLALIDFRYQQIEPAEAFFVKIEGNSG